MGLMDTVVTYDDSLRRGICLDRERVESLTHQKMEMTVGDILRLRLEPLWLFRTVMHPEILPATIMHLIAVTLARFEVDVFKDTGGYVDIRSRRLLNVKEAWSVNLASLGSLRGSHALAHGVPTLLAEELEKRAGEIAHLVELAAIEDPRRAVILTAQWVLKNGASDSETRVRTIALQILEKYDAA